MREIHHEFGIGARLAVSMIISELGARSLAARDVEHNTAGSAPPA